MYVISVFDGFRFQFVCGMSLRGHTDWVRDVACARERDDVLLASCSQDTSIRLWRISQQQQESKQQQQQQEEGEGELKLKGDTLSLESGAVFTVTLESVMIGRFLNSVRFKFKSRPSVRSR